MAISSFPDPRNHSEGKQFALFRDLLHQAHQEGLSLLSTKLIQIPTEANQWTSIVQATVQTQKGTFQGFGDASPGNVSPEVSPHYIRMAETRALARALRFATNVGMTALEELGGISDRILADPPKEARHQEPSVSSPPVQPTVNPSPPATEPQLRAIHAIAGNKGMTEKSLEAFVQETFKAPLEQLTIQEASSLIDKLKTKNGNGYRKNGQGKKVYS